MAQPVTKATKVQSLSFQSAFLKLQRVSQGNFCCFRSHATSGVSGHFQVCFVIFLWICLVLMVCCLFYSVSIIDWVTEIAINWSFVKDFPQIMRKHCLTFSLSLFFFLFFLSARPAGYSLVVRAEKVKVGSIRCFIYFFMIGTHRGLLLFNIKLPNISGSYTNCKMPPLVGNNNMQ